MTVEKPPFTIADPSLDRYRPIAALIAAEADPPSWLVRQLRDWAPSILMSQAIDVLQPKRSELLKRMRAVQNACRTLGQAIADGPTMEFLDLLPPEPLDAARAQSVLVDLQARSQLVLQHPAFVTPDGRTRSGRSRASPPGATTAKDECAALIAEAWLFCRGREAAPRSKKACRAAQIFWEASGGRDQGWGTTRHEGWRPHFDKAAGPQLKTWRLEIRRCLDEEKSGPREPAALG